jgi:GrpB-like predicted nucleotidyltransferase (UPF0157 family)
MPSDHKREAGLIGGLEKKLIQIVDDDPPWPTQLQIQSSRIATALGGAALRIEPIGSTSVPSLAASSHANQPRRRRHRLIDDA